MKHEEQSDHLEDNGNDDATVYSDEFSEADFEEPDFDEPPVAESAPKVGGKGPQIDLRGNRIPEDLGWFKLPKNIGEYVCGHTDMSANAKPTNLQGRDRRMMIGGGIGAVVGLVAVIVKGIDESILTIALFVVPILIGVFLAIRSNTLLATNIIIGKEGFAYYICRDTFTQLDRNDEVRFDEITDLIVQAETIDLNPASKRNVFVFKWLNRQSHTEVYQSKFHYDPRGFEASPLVMEFCLECMQQWTTNLLSGLEAKLAKGQEETFRSYDQANNSYRDFARISKTTLTILREDGSSVAYPFQDIEKLKVQDGWIRFRHKDAQRKTIFSQPDKSEAIQLKTISNLQYFLRALSLASGHPLKDFESGIPLRKS
ncbi:MAG: hypothetical protein U0176_13205 [Bacteroidia bacterium]